MAGQQKKTGSRKCGRSVVKCRGYRLAGTREKNKARKIKRHLKAQPNDKMARGRLLNLHPRVRTNGKRARTAE